MKKLNYWQQLAHKYANTHKTYNLCRYHFLYNVVNSKYSDATDRNISDFWAELKIIL